MLKEFRERLSRDTQALDAAGLLKRERVIGSAQGPVVRLADGREMINLCANNYLGLADDPRVVKAAQRQMAKLPHAMGDVHPHALKARLARELSQTTFQK